MMTTYTRRGPGQSYLKGVLADRINSLIEHRDLNLEINPLKVSLAFAGERAKKIRIYATQKFIEYGLIPACRNKRVHSG